jgi:hypothetical protein
MWTSDAIPGRVQGTPIISQVDLGMYVFFTHNRMNQTSNQLVGSFSMIDGSTGAWMFTESAGDSRMDPIQLSHVDTLRLPYAALGVAHQPEWGRYPGGEGNGHDLFIWSTSVSNGRGEGGYTRAFQLPKLFEPDFTPALFTYFLREDRWNAMNAPAITLDGMNVVFGVSENKVIGWTGKEDFDQLPITKQSLGSDPTDERLRTFCWLVEHYANQQEHARPKNFCFHFFVFFFWQRYPSHRYFSSPSVSFLPPPQPLNFTLYKPRRLILGGRCQALPPFLRSPLSPTMIYMCTPQAKMGLSQLMTRKMVMKCGH